MQGEDVGNRAVERSGYAHGFTQLHRDISLIRKPTIAMINGPAVGSGMDMALHCDIRIGCERTRFIGYHNAGQIIENFKTLRAAGASSAKTDAPLAQKPRPTAAPRGRVRRNLLRQCSRNEQRGG
jgi:hypothetical protein